MDQRVNQKEKLNRAESKRLLKQDPRLKKRIAALDRRITQTALKVIPITQKLKKLQDEKAALLLTEASQ